MNARMLMRTYPRQEHLDIERRVRELGVTPTWVISEDGHVRYLQLWLFRGNEYRTFRITIEALVWTAVDPVEYAIEKMRYAMERLPA